ncbi:Localisation of periplasmic protein complexes [Desulfocapsa sulfexigens DSM 10523]|uniref:Localisation of periplasmic protein complexes n=1 Tax=Desulfocapsa sulfexigens (strain DSM 10523 / SB164P1) TaxID=1167006 RepID=M1PU74_DESSD|nr:AMIN domain-containing protein [Desulfocapsa sulfexigens]AGF79881.1 Localisation of periplasmic protein complexes [Desulfocapsa sulfexigens DSM 10523]
MNGRKFVFSVAVLASIFLFSGMLHAAEGLIEKVEFQKDNGKIESVVFHLNGPWLPKIFSLKGDNPRVVFDFMETAMVRSVPNAIETQGTMIQKIRLGRHADKTRVVIDLTAGGDFNFDQQFDEQNNIFTVQLFSANFPEKDAVAPEKVIAEEPVAETIAAEPVQDIVATAATAEVVESEKPAEPVENSPAPQEEEGPGVDPLLLEVTFENTSNKGEMILFKLNGFYPPEVVGEEEGTPLVICNFPGTRLDEKVVQTQAIHGEYIEQVNIQELKDSDLVRVTLELVPSKNYDLQQVFFKEDNLFVIIVNSYDSLDGMKK